MAHLHEDIDWTVEVFVVHDNKVLLRMHEKYKIWLSVGGHIELDEDPVEAAVREVEEEVGLKVTIAGDIESFPKKGHKELIPPVFMNRHRINETHEHISLVYFATTKDPTIIPSEEEKSEDIRWVTLEELEGLDLNP